MESYIFTSSLADFVRLRRIAAWILVSVALFAIAKTFQQISPEASHQDTYVLLSAMLVFRLLPLVAIILSSAIVAQEVEQRTIVYLLTRPVPRWKYIVFRSISATIVVFGISAFAEFVTSIATVGLHNPLLLRDLEALAAGSAAYVALFVFASLVFNRSMIICLLYAFVWETSVSGLPGDLYRLTISSYVTSIAHHPALGEAKTGINVLTGLMPNNTMTASTGWIALGVFTIFCTIVSCIWFTRFEFTPREDAE